MRTLLVISSNLGLAPAIATGLDGNAWRVRTATDPATAIEHVGPALLDAIVIDGDASTIAAVVAKCRQAFPAIPLIAAVEDPAAGEDALTAGATTAFAKPLRIGLLNDWLRRQLTSPPATTAPLPPPTPMAGEQDCARSLSALEGLANLADIISHTLEPDELAREFLLHVRDLTGCNRAAVFLRDPRPESDLFHRVFATGLPPTEATLNLAEGIGAHLIRAGRVLRREEGDEQTRREFADTGAEYAIPVMDRQRLVGIALLDRRVAGEAFDPGELTRLFKAFEVLGVALARARRHAAVAAAEALATGVFDTLDTGCVVITPDQSIAHCNPAARRLLRLPERPALSDLPAPMVAKIYALLRDGAQTPHFQHTSKDEPERVFEVSLKPVPLPGQSGGAAALLTLSDISARRASQAGELNSARDGLVRSMAEHLAHEMGNTLVPLSTGHQLMALEEPDNRVFKEMEGVFGESVRRIERLTRQMQFLSREGLRDVEDIPIAEVLREAFAEAGRLAKVADARLVLRGEESLHVTGERRALRQAFIEILLNALQSADSAVVEVELHATAGMVAIDTHDGGPGFENASRERGAEPFYSGRTVGTGLGLTVARRLADLHGGGLQLQPADAGRGGCVRLLLPLPTTSETA